MEEGQGPFPEGEGKRSVGISQRQKERSTLEEGLSMAKPEWAGPFAPIPENWDEFRRAVWTTGILTGIYTAIWAVNVWNTIPRMASHYYANPSRRAIVGHAIRQTPATSVMRSITGFGVWTPVAIIVLGITAADYLREFRNLHFEGSVDQLRIENARSMAMGGFGTHVIGDFHHQPYYEAPSGERVWYSFHPEWI